MAVLLQTSKRSSQTRPGTTQLTVDTHAIAIERKASKIISVFPRTVFLILKGTQSKEGAMPLAFSIYKVGLELPTFETINPPYLHHRGGKTCHLFGWESSRTCTGDCGWPIFNLSILI